MRIWGNIIIPTIAVCPWLISLCTMHLVHLLRVARVFFNSSCTAEKSKSRDSSDMWGRHPAVSPYENQKESQRVPTFNDIEWKGLFQKKEVDRWKRTGTKKPINPMKTLNPELHVQSPGYVVATWELQMTWAASYLLIAFIFWWLCSLLWLSSADVPCSWHFQFPGVATVLSVSLSQLYSLSSGTLHGLPGLILKSGWKPQRPCKL